MFSDWRTDRIKEFQSNPCQLTETNKRGVGYSASTEVDNDIISVCSSNEVFENESNGGHAHKNVNILLFTETWSNDLFNYDVEGFHFYISHRKRLKSAKRDSGGLIIYVNNKLKQKVDFVKKTEENIV